MLSAIDRAEKELISLKQYKEIDDIMIQLVNLRIKITNEMNSFSNRLKSLRNSVLGRKYNHRGKKVGMWKTKKKDVVIVYWFDLLTPNKINKKTMWKKEFDNAFLTIKDYE